jgi:hypothetical protein
METNSNLKRIKITCKGDEDMELVVKVEET